MNQEQKVWINQHFYYLLAGYSLLILYLGSKWDNIKLLCLSAGIIGATIALKYAGYRYVDAAKTIMRVKYELKLAHLDLINEETKPEECTSEEYPTGTGDMLVSHAKKSRVFTFSNKEQALIGIYHNMTRAEYINDYPKGLLDKETFVKTKLELGMENKKELKKGDDDE